MTAEYLKLTQLEYIALTEEGYESKKYFEIINEVSLSDDQYEEKIGLKSPWEYWSYKSEAEPLSTSERIPGLMFIRSQFLPRAGM